MKVAEELRDLILAIQREGNRLLAAELRAAYPRLDEFIGKKRHHDPQLRFGNLMWDKYFA